MKTSVRLTSVRVVAIAALSMAFTGCGQNNDVVEVKFPDVSQLPKPAAPPDKGKSKAATGPMSQGDPSSYSRR
jgi:hypothetical protein